MSQPQTTIYKPPLFRRSLAYHVRMNLAVALGVLAGTAVLTGALLVGDSVRGSLRHLALDGLGRIDHAIVATHFFQPDWAESLPSAPAFTVHSSPAEVQPCILLQGTVSNPSTNVRANQVTLIGCDTKFFHLFDGPGKRSGDSGTPARHFAGNDVFLNRPLAAALGVDRDGEVIVRLPTPSDIPRDSPLGRKTETVSTRRVKVQWVMPAEGAGRFTLNPAQTQPLIAYLPLQTLQQALGQEGRVNALMIASDYSGELRWESLLNAHPRWNDYGIRIADTDRGFSVVSSEHMVLETAAETALVDYFRAQQIPAQPVLTYLANYITCGDNDRGKIPYSTVTALDVTTEPPLGPFETVDGAPLTKIDDDKIVLNEWAWQDFAEQGITLKPGDEVRLTYFEPESTHGKVQEKTANFKLQAVVKLSGAAADRLFTPELKGVTDEASIADWNPPFPYDPKRVRSTKPNDKDEQYWDQHRATPKAFVSLAAGRKLWSSRFGQTTAIRVTRDKASLADELSALPLDPDAMGFALRPVRYLALQAATGTTPFNLLFLGFSMFIIAAAVMLVALLFRLSIERRAQEIGILLAMGWSRMQVRRLLLTEGLVIASLGGALGVVAGIGYAWLMLAGLRTWWLAAISAPFLHFDWEASSLAVGGLCGVGVSLLAIVWALRNMRGASARQLLAGNTADESRPAQQCRGWSPYVAWGSLVAAGLLSAGAFGLSGEAQAGAFFGAGSLVLTGLMSLAWRRLVTGSTASLVAGGPGPIVRLAMRNAARHPSRSTLTIGLVSSAAFLIVAISAFHLDPPASYQRKESGTGGFALLAESSVPMLVDLNDPDGRFDLGFSDNDEKLLADCRFFSLRSQPGDDASCLNLYQPQQPRVLGITSRQIERGGFEWAGTAADDDATRSNPWLLLERPRSKTSGGDDVVPVVIDAATAMFSLHLSGVGARFTIKDDRGQPLALEVVGLLKNSIFQGRLLVSESQFLRHFPSVEGYGFFLVDAPVKEMRAVREKLAGGLGDFGFSVRPTTEVLLEFLAVQNTYLSTFQSLGGLGLLLGTLGLATVQLRNVLERRGELALLQATGFRKALLARLVFYENASLLLGGLAVGVAAALVAILPHLIAGGAAIPWSSLAITLGLVTIVGLLAGMLAVRAVLKTPVLAALRGE